MLLKRGSIIPYILIVLFYLNGSLTAQDLATLYNYGNAEEDLRAYLISKTGSQFLLPENNSQFKTQDFVLADTSYHHLSCTADFDGDGFDEVALFQKKVYTPNCFVGYSCPPYATTNVVVLKSDGASFSPVGNWYAALDSSFNAASILFTVTGDYNNDSKSDIAVVTLTENDSLKVSVLISTDSSFLAPQVFYQSAASSFKLDSIAFALGGDYDADGYADIALLCKENSTDFIKVLSSDGNAFSEPDTYYSFPDSINYTNLHFATSGRFSLDATSDIALLYTSTDSSFVTILEENSGQFEQNSPINISADIDAYSKILFTASSDFNDDSYSDIALVFDTQLGVPTVQKILVLHSNDSVFDSPVTYLETNTNEYNFYRLEYFLAGNYAYSSPVKVCTWQNNKLGALTFSMDDGYTSTVQNAYYLYEKGVLGTHNIITNLSGTEEYVPWNLMQLDTLGNEYGSHSYTHARLNQISIAEANDQFVYSKQQLDANLSTKAVSFVFPGGGFNYEVMQSPSLRDNYLSARTSMRGYNLATPTDEYALKAQVILNTTPLSSSFYWIDQTEVYSYYTLLMYHFIDYQGSDTDLMEYNSSIADFQATVDYACHKNLWLDTQEHIIKYIKSRNAIQEIDYSIVNDTTIRLSFDDGLADSVFNVPVTLQVLLPSSWVGDSVIVQKASVISVYAVVDKDGQSYVYLNALPNGEELLVVESNTISSSNKPVFQEEMLFNIFPNPVINSALISVSKECVSEDTSFIIYDNQGQRVQTLYLNGRKNILFKRNNLSAGLYLIVMYENYKMISSTKIIVR